jgi:FRG domain
MQKITRLRLASPRTLADGSTVTEFVAGDAVTISREPPYGEPAEVVVSGPWGRFVQGWQESMGMITTEDAIGPRPHVTVSLRHAHDFIEYLAADYAEGRRIFRGVSSAEYELLPSALRRGPIPPFKTLASTNKDQITLEARAAIDFYDAVYYQGLTIPRWNDVAEIFDIVRFHLSKSVWTDRLPPAWPHPSLNEFLAIAQHHGVAARLLDWTLDPMVASYFSAWDLERSSDLIAVWVVDLGADWHFRQMKHHPLNLVFVPYDVNKNAHAQRGVFTMYLYQYLDDEPPRRWPYDEFLSRYAAEDPAGAVQKVTLPGREVPRLLQLLEQRRVNGSTMFPGYYGAARAARERAFWDR